MDAATRYFNVNVGGKDTKKSLALNVSENYTVSTMMVMKGAEYEKNADGIWLSDKFSDANDIQIGDTLTVTYQGLEITCEVIGLVKSGENLICVADENQLMPDYEAFGFAYITPKTLEDALGFAFYPQINIISDMDKAELEEAIQDATGTTFLVTTKDEHYSYAGVMSEAEEGKTMGSILPVLFLAIAVLTMVTTMHRISANEAESVGMDYHIGYVYTDTASENIESSSLISGKQDKDMIMDSYDTFMEIMNVMIVVLAVAAIVLGIVVLYNLGVMSYVERHRELATLKVLGFRDKQIGKLLITQNIWLTFISAALGLPGGVGILYILVTALASEYELSITMGPATYIISIALTFGVSLLVGWMVSRKNRKIDMVEALKGAE